MIVGPGRRLVADSFDRNTSAVETAIFSTLNYDVERFAFLLDQMKSLPGSSLRGAVPLWNRDSIIAAGYGLPGPGTGVYPNHPYSDSTDGGQAIFGAIPADPDDALETYTWSFEPEPHYGKHGSLVRTTRTALVFFPNLTDTLDPDSQVENGVVEEFGALYQATLAPLGIHAYLLGIPARSAMMYAPLTVAGLIDSYSITTLSTAGTGIRQTRTFTPVLRTQDRGGEVFIGWFGTKWPFGHCGYSQMESIEMSYLLFTRGLLDGNEYAVPGAGWSLFATDGVPGGVGVGLRTFICTSKIEADAAQLLNILPNFKKLKFHFYSSPENDSAALAFPTIGDPADVMDYIPDGVPADYTAIGATGGAAELVGDIEEFFAT